MSLTYRNTSTMETKHTILLLLILITLSHAVQQYPVYGTINFPSRLSNGTTTQFSGMSAIEKSRLYARMSVYMVGNQIQQQSFVLSNGSFVFYDVLPGAYFLQVDSPDLLFPSLHVSVSKRHNGRVRGKYVVSESNVAYPFVLQPVMFQQYFEEVKPLGLIGLLTGNKMLWFAAFSMVVMFLGKQMQGSEAIQEVTDQVITFKPKEHLPTFFPDESE
eukprot:TRINITY_DN13544_c0_g1_i2.p1 TRINITY_DN13544_c0_g1~~TRINITY_DN13544_c0_g1_i2.p1  ORF type:complete len:217 (+),score=37.41 TRINITY_DN13544_c0_g1_i2:2-652(+)